MKVITKPHKFYGKNPALITRCDEILSSLHSQGFNITLRGLFYQLVSRNIIENNEKEYGRLGELITNARRAGLIDWNHIVDHTRKLEENNHWQSPEDIVQACVNSYKIDLRATQTYRPEIWVEKSALLGVLAPTCKKLDVPLLATRGNPSATVLWDARNRIEQNYRDKNQATVIFYFGDHDPTGMNIPVSIRNEFEYHLDEMGMGFKRIALTKEQVDQYCLPPNKPNENDKNYDKYKAEFGPKCKCWELDALSPDVLIGLVVDAINSVTYQDRLDEQIELQEQGRDELRKWAA